MYIIFLYFLPVECTSGAFRYNTSWLTCSCFPLHRVRGRSLTSLGLRSTAAVNHEPGEEWEGSFVGATPVGPCNTTQLLRCPGHCARCSGNIGCRNSCNSVFRKSELFIFFFFQPQCSILGSLYTPASHLTGPPPPLLPTTTPLLFMTCGIGSVKERAKLVIVWCEEHERQTSCL